MPVHIEFSSDATPSELRALTVFIEALRPNTPRAEPDRVGANVHGIGPDTDPEVRIPAPPPLIDTTQEFKAPEPKVTPELDSTGIPWDGRIHASTKSIKSDGQWTAKRNVAADFVTAVTAELRQNMAAAPVPANIAEGPMFTEPAQAFGQPAAATVPAPPAEAAAAIPSPPAEPEPKEPMAEFARIMRVVVEKQKAGTVSTEMAVALVQQLGLTDIRGLSTRPDLISAFEALLP